MSDKIELHAPVAAMAAAHKANLKHEGAGKIVEVEDHKGFAALPAFIEAHGKKAQVKLTPELIAAVQGGDKSIPLTPEMVEVAARFNSDDVCALKAAVGETAIDIWSKDKSIENVFHHSEVSNTKIDWTAVQSKTYGIGDNQVTKNCIVNHTINTKACGTRGAAKRVTAYLHQVYNDAGI